MDEKELLEKVKSLYKSEDYSSIIELVETYKTNIRNYYHPINIIYLKSLLAVEEIDKAASLVEEELSMPYIPLEYENDYQEIYKSIFSYKMEKNVFDTKNFSEEEIKEALNKRPLDENIFLVLADLKNKNIRIYLEDLKNLMMDKNIANFIKILVIEALKEQEVNCEMFFCSETASIKINPISFSYFVDYNYLDDIFEELKDKSKDINLINYAKEISIDLLTNYLPLEINSDDIPNIAATSFYKANKALGIDLNYQDLEKIFINSDIERVKYFLTTIKGVI